MAARWLRTTARILRPVPELPDALEVVILIAILLGAPIGTGAIVANAVAGIPGIAWGLVTLFLSLSFLSIWAVFRFEGRAPPRVEGVDSDRSCRRVKVHNPNQFTLEGCYVALRQAKVISSDGPAEAPGQGFHFAWGSWQVQGSGLLSNLPPKTDRFVDLVGLSEQNPSDLHFYHHTTSGNQMFPIRQVFQMPVGVYHYELELGAKDIPAMSTARIQVVFKKNRELTIELLTD